MKKVFTTILMITIGFAGAFAQEEAASDKKSIVKLNALSLIFTNISMQYEYSLNPKSSLALGVSYLPSRGIPGMVDFDDPENNAKNIEFSGFSLTPEYRYYFSGKGPKGFYGAGYFRYSKYSFDDMSFNYESESGTDKITTVSGDFTATTVGIMFGAQWMLGENWSLDWWILGGGFGSQKGEFNAPGTYSVDDQQDLLAEINEIDVPVVDIEATVTSSNAKIEIESSMPAIRGFGLCIGYRF